MVEGKVVPDLGLKRTPQNSLRGHSWGNRPDIRIFFLANFGILIRIVPPYLKFSKFYPDYREIASKNFTKFTKKIDFI